MLRSSRNWRRDLAWPSQDRRSWYSFRLQRDGTCSASGPERNLTSQDRQKVKGLGYTCGMNRNFPMALLVRDMMDTVQGLYGDQPDFEHHT